MRFRDRGNCDCNDTSIESQIQRMTTQRDTLASQVKSILDAVAFDGQGLTEQQAATYIGQRRVCSTRRMRSRAADAYSSGRMGSLTGPRGDVRDPDERWLANSQEPLSTPRS